MRTVKQQHKAIRENIEGLITYRAMPAHELHHIDPFLFLNHHGPQEYPPGNTGLPFGPHPHRGFETVTYIFSGDVVHQDTQGYQSTIETGGVQWMTAGKGLLHSETSSAEFRKNGGHVEVIQIWLNLPSSLKMADPKYIGLQKMDIPILDLDNNRVTVNVVSGQWADTKGAVDSLTDIHMSSIELKKSGSLTIEVDPDRNILFYIVNGKLRINGETAGLHTLVEFNHDGSTVKLEALENSLILFGHGKPFNESIIAQGPFVMNTEEEIAQAVKDYQSGKMGIWNGEQM